MTVEPETRVLYDLADLEGLAVDWARLAARFATPLLEPDWFLAAAETLYGAGDLRVVVVFENGVVSGIAPLAVSRTFGGRLAVMGACRIHEPGGWLYSSNTALALLTRAVLRLGHVAVLQRLPPELADQLPALSRGRGVAIVRPAKPTYRLDTAGGWEAQLARLSPSAIRERKHMERRLRRVRDEVAITRVRPGPAEIPAVLDAFVAIEAAGWKGREGSALARHPDMRRFYRTYLTRAAARGRVVTWSLHIQGQLAAMQIDLEAYRRYWALRIGHDERFAKHSPGLLLADASIRAVYAHGLESYEFLGAAERWQERWAPAPREYRAVALYALSSRGLLGLGSDAMRYLGRKLSKPPRALAPAS